jgi:NAD(P)-dependent dehydrogenase (short-subunit alcohol dehydrogenase family)
VLLPHGQRPVGFRGLTATSLTPRSASRARVAQTTPKSQANASGTVVSWPSVVLSVSLGTFEVNVVAPAGMVRGNAYAATKAALEAHTVNLAAELRGTGVTVNAYRPGGVDTAMQAWIRGQDPGRIGAGLHERFNKNFADGVLITPEHSAAALLAYLAGDDTGAIWDVSVAPTRT